MIILLEQQSPCKPYAMGQILAEKKKKLGKIRDLGLYIPKTKCQAEGQNPMPE